ncbi:Lin0512 family protein [Tateyamaria sp. Alg231-49]|uniref:Lin0512 family protein n=1 Tax=Tateyamaria sp. Alg231-49 TaxID=1922219 RepID=UPI000D54F051|nr:Lin0512 family protein [Tateyamaria sp. Alg231-49]
MGPMIVEFGLGTSLRRGDYTQAAERAVRAALWRNSINLAEYIGVAKEDMVIEVRIGCAQPDAVDVDVLASAFPYGQTSFVVEKGGLDVVRPEGTGNPTVMAQAALIVSVDASERPLGAT